MSEIYILRCDKGTDQSQKGWRTNVRFGVFLETDHFTATFFDCEIFIVKRCQWDLRFSVCPFYPPNCRYSTMTIKLGFVVNDPFNMSSPRLPLVPQWQHILIGVNQALGILLRLWENLSSNAPIWKSYLPFLCFAHPENLARQWQNELRPCECDISFSSRDIMACKRLKHGSYPCLSSSWHLKLQTQKQRVLSKAHCGTARSGCNSAPRLNFRKETSDTVLGDH